MVKKKNFRKKANGDLFEMPAEMSRFIDCDKEYSKDDIIKLSKPKKYEAVAEENFQLPARHIYSSVVDFTAKKFQEHIEDPLTLREIEEGCIYAREVVAEFAKNGPEYELNPDDLKTEIKPGMSIGYMLDTLTKSKYREEFIKFLGKYQTKNINERSTKRYSNKDCITTNYRKKIINMHCKNMTPRDICKNTYGRYPIRYIEEFIELYQIHGIEALTMEFKPRPNHKLNDDQIKFLCELTEDPKNIGLSLKERKHILCNHFHIKVKTDDIREALKQEGYSMKRIRNVVPEADNIPHKNARCRVAQQLVYFLRAGRELISVDETQITRGDNLIFGWSKRGIRATSVAQRKGRPLHIIAAIAKDRVLGYMVRYERVEKYSYKNFLKNLFDKLRELDPVNYKQRFFVLMDNAGAHKHKYVKDFIESQDVTVLCNAPMTPQLQPIEFVFSIFKHYVRKVQLDNEEDLFWSVYQSFRKMTSRQIHNTYLHTMRAYESGIRYADFQHNTNPYVTDGKIRRSGKMLSHMVNFEKLFNEKQIPKF